MNSEQFKIAMSNLPEPKTNLRPPYWEYWRHNLWELACNDIPEKFMHWPCIGHCMLVRHWPHAIDYEYNQLMTDKERWQPVIEMSVVGNDYYRETSYSQNLIHQAYHLKLWEDTTGKRLDKQKSITEFGGGYGAMALVCRRLGFVGDYVIYDLPEFSLLQQWFLSQCGVEATWPGRFTQDKVDLLLALYSLSETPLGVRGVFLGTVKAKSYLFLYSGPWQEYDNSAYFRSVEYLAHNWSHSELTWLPDKKNWYSIGW